MRLYVVQTGSGMLVNNRRNIKIGYHEKNGNETTKYYLAAAAEDNFEVSMTKVRANNGHMRHSCSYLPVI